MERHEEKWSFTQTVESVGECGYRCVKFTFFCFNLLFWMAGCVILAIGIWLHSQKDEAAKDYAHISGHVNYINGPTFCIAVGVITILVSFLACCGAKTGNVCMLGCYFGLLCLIFSLEIAAITVTYVYRERVETTLRKDFKRTLNQYGLPEHESLTKAIDELQKDFHCCGNIHYSDWYSTNWGMNNTKTVPVSCCKLPREKDCNRVSERDKSKINLVGCYPHVKKYLLENLHIISGFGLWIAAIELLGMVFSLCLICKKKREEEFYA